MGLPDLYSTDENDENPVHTPDEWSVMDYGPYNNNSRTPAATLRVHDCAGRTIAAATAYPSGNATLLLPAAGIYIATDGNATIRIAAR